MISKDELRARMAEDKPRLLEQTLKKVEDQLLAVASVGRHSMVLIDVHVHVRDDVCAVLREAGYFLEDIDGEIMVCWNTSNS